MSFHLLIYIYISLNNSCALDLALWQSKTLLFNKITAAE